MRRTVTAIAVGTLAAGLFSNTAPALAGEEPRPSSWSCAWSPSASSPGTSPFPPPHRRLMSLRTCRRRPPKRSTTPCSPRHARATPSPSLLLKPSTPAALAQGCTRKHDGLGPVREDRPIRAGESATALEGGLPKATAGHGSRGSARCGKSGAVQRPRCGFFGLVRRCLPHEQRTSENPKKRNGFCDAPDHQGGGSSGAAACLLAVSSFPPSPRRADWSTDVSIDLPVLDAEVRPQRAA